jgi:predicted Fe-Mo cluster-binding NifX family protein
MKFAIPTVDGKFDAPFSARFARCEVFIFVDSESGSRETVPNPAAAASGGAGAQVVQFLADHGVGATVAGHYGPTAMAALKAAGIQAFAADSGTPAELLDRLQAGTLERVDTAPGAARQ